MIRPQNCDLILCMPDIEAFFEEFESDHEDIVQKIVVRSYGRKIPIRDCDGHKIMIAG